MAAPRKQNTNTINIDWQKVAIVAIALLVAAIIAIICICNYSLLKKGDSDTDPDQTGGSKQVIAISDVGEKLYDGGTYAMPKAMTIVAEAPVESNYAPDGEFTITATTDNEYINGNFDFTCYFMDDSDDWTDGKEASECIEITPISAASAKVKLLAPFGAPIEIKAQLIGSASSATCRVDYLKKYELIKTYFSEVKGSYDNDYGSPDRFTNLPLDFGDYGKLITATWYRHGSGTVMSKLIIRDCTLRLKSEFVESFKSYLKFDITVKDLNVQATADSYNYRDFGDDLSYQIEGYEFVFETLEYSMFIENFNSFNEHQKQAIYYAWYAAFTNLDTANNIEMQINHIQLLYLDTVINEAYQVNHDNLIGRAAISGARYGENAVPDVELNGGITF